MSSRVVEKDGKKARDCIPGIFPHKPENYEEALRILKEHCVAIPGAGRPGIVTKLIHIGKTEKVETILFV